jgi:hypothetical protein
LNDDNINYNTSREELDEEGGEEKGMIRKEGGKKSGWKQLLSIMKSRKFVLALIYIVVNMLWLNMYIGTIGKNYILLQLNIET